jgi:hypothetical protein
MVRLFVPPASLPGLTKPATDWPEPEASRRMLLANELRPGQVRTELIF